MLNDENGKEWVCQYKDDPVPIPENIKYKKSSIFINSEDMIKDMLKQWFNENKDKKGVK